MVTIFQNTETKNAVPKPYGKKQEIDTRIPPKAKPVFNAVSVNGIAIAESDILSEAQNHPASSPGDALLQAARALVVRELLWQEAQRLGVVCEDAVNASNSALPTPVDTAIERLMAQEINVPQASLEDCQRYFDKNHERFLSDMIVEARHILLAADPKITEDREGAKRVAQQIIRSLEAQPARFGELAREYSACPSSAQGGNLGQITCGSTVPEFEQALRAAKTTGLVPVPIESRYGFHVIDIIRKISGKPLPFDMVEERIRAWLEASSWSRAVSQYIIILAGKAKIEGIEVLPANGPLVQ